MRHLPRSNDEAIGLTLKQYGLDLSKVQAGDVGVAHSTGFLGWLIRFGTRSTYNHAFVVVDPGEHTPETIQVVQAEAHGVELTTLNLVAPGGSYAILPCPVGVDREIVVREAKALLRTKYAFVSCVSVGFGILMHALHIPFRLAVRDTSTLICSAVLYLALFNGGWDWNVPDAYNVTPAQIAVEVGNAALVAANRTKRKRAPRKTA